MTWKPHVTVAAIIQNDDKFLMVEECIDGAMRYNQPAGHLEPGESLTDAVIRETLEETAWHFKPASLTGIYRWNNPANNRTFLRFSFTGDCLNHDSSLKLDKDIHQVLWMTLADIEARSNALRSPMVLQSLYDFLNGTHYPLAILKELA